MIPRVPSDLRTGRRRRKDASYALLLGLATFLSVVASAGVEEPSPVPSGDVPPAMTHSDAITAQAAALRGRAEAELRGDILPFWIKHAPDPTRGGFFGEIGSDLTVKPDAARGALLTAALDYPPW